MNETTSFIDEVMGFDPADAVTAFENTNNEKKVNPNIYKTNPSDSVSEDGHYRSRVRILLNPYNLSRNIIHQEMYSMRDEHGFFQAISKLSDGNKDCPLFTAWKKLYFATLPDPKDAKKRIVDEERREWSRKFDKRRSDWVLVQIIDDDNKPELVGQFKVMKVAKDILTRLLEKMNPSDPKEQKQPLMDYLFGPVLKMNVVPGPDDPDAPERKQREISYSLCDFDTDPTPIIKTDGTPLFTDEEIELIEDYNTANNDLIKAKTQAKADAAKAKKAELAPKIRPLYAKAIEYIKTYAIDPVVECGYTEWSDELTARVNAWIEKMLRLEDPEGATSAANKENKNEKSASSEEKSASEDKHEANTDTFDANASDETDLPF